MHKEIVIRSFKKAKSELIRETGIFPSTSRCAQYLSIVIYDDNKFSYSEKSLRNLLRQAVAKSNEDFEIKQTQVVFALCHFLGYPNYEDFVKTRSEDESKVKKEIINEKNDSIESEEYDHEEFETIISESIDKRFKISVFIKVIPVHGGL